MKNIHVLPTDKPSRLAKHSTGSFHIVEYKHHKKGLYRMTNQNTYITNDEEIKEGDWCIDNRNALNKIINVSTNGYLMVENGNSIKHNNCKKIILTTDQDLIKDGVQAIDDEFLEWFVKNPSCEEVKTTFIKNGWCLKEAKDHSFYKIIIPKEEPKQECDCDNTCDKCEEKEKQQILQTAKEKAKQETLEEIFDIIDDIKCRYSTEESEFWKHYKIGVLDGLKWQQEQDKNKYSEEEVREILYQHTCELYKREPQTLDEFFNKFKKK